MDRLSYISNSDVSYIDDLYQKYKADAESVDISWQRFFEGFEFSQSHNGTPNGHPSPTLTSQSSTTGISLKELGVRNLIHAYRTRGHLKSDTNPVRPRRKHNVLLELTDFGLTNEDLEVEYEYEVGHSMGLGKAKLSDILAHSKKCISVLLDLSTCTSEIMK